MNFSDHEYKSGNRQARVGICTPKKLIICSTDPFKPDITLNFVS